MATLYELTNQYKMLQQFIEDNDAEGFELALSQIEGEVAEKLESYAMVIKNVQSDIDGLKAEIERLSARKKAMETSVDRMKNAMSDTLLTVEGNRLKTDKFTFSFRKSSSVQISGDALIPSQYIKIETEIKYDKKGISQALRNGEKIVGAELVEKQSLSIR